MKYNKQKLVSYGLFLLRATAALIGAGQETQHPLFIMADNIGWSNALAAGGFQS